MSRSGTAAGLRPPAFAYRGARLQKQLYCEKVSLEDLASRYGTPLYVYSAAMVRARIRSFARAFRSIPHTICYSVKANSTLGILRLLAREGAGFDVVSGGELERVLRISPKSASQVVFSGVGKTAAEMELAVRSGIMLFNIESASELNLLAATAARLKKPAEIAMRVNPDVSAKTHPYISTGLHQHKFGVPLDQAESLYAVAAQSKFLKVTGVSVHIGSQITDMRPFTAAMERVAELVRELRRLGHDVRYVDAGGGLGISYTHAQDSRAFERYVASYAQAVLLPLRKLNVTILLEPGRSIVGPAGVLLTRVIYKKSNGARRFLIIDAAMNDLVRPSLYNAYHEIFPVREPQSGSAEIVDVVGPVCETGDFIARNRELPATQEGDLLAVMDCGAYGMVLASNYNARPRPAEVLVQGKVVRVVRRRETLAELVRDEL